MGDSHRCPSSWNSHQQTFLTLLQHPENHQLSITGLCQKAGYPNTQYWYRAATPDFKQAVHSLRQQFGGFDHEASQPSQCPEWKPYHQGLLDLLQDPANRQLSAKQLCQKAGLPNEGVWYRAFDHPVFAAAAEQLGVARTRRSYRSKATPDQPKWTKTQLTLLALLQVPENRNLTALALCQKAGLNSRKPWYNAIKHPHFKAAVQALGVETNRLGFFYNENPKDETPQWTSTHQRFVDVLQHEANRDLSLTQICALAGFSHFTAWYRALKHPEFRTQMIALGIDIQRHGLYQAGHSRAQRAILQVLQSPANRQLPVFEICQLAGYSDDYWYKSLASPDFVQAVRNLGVEVERRQYNENGWTEIQQKFLDCLQEPENRQFRPTDLSHKAGFPNCTYWFRALKNPRFVEVVEKLGVTIWRKGRNETGFTRAQQEFFDLLQETPITTAAELSRRAGRTSTSSWTEVIRDSHFTEQLELYGFYVHRVSRPTDGITHGQRHLISLLEDEANRELSISQLCKLAGYSTSMWYRALERPPVAEKIRELGVRLQRCGPDEEGWTLAQRRLMEVLVDEANRHLPILELCHLAGYSDKSRWYESLTSEQFLALLTEWDVPIQRRHEPYTPHIYLVPVMNINDELHKDVWDIRKVKQDYPKHRAPAQYILDFTWIKNPQLKAQVQQFFRLRLARWEAGTFLPQLYMLKTFLINLPEDIHLGNLTRAHVDAILPKIYSEQTDVWVRQSLRSTRAVLNFARRSYAWDGPRPAPFLLSSDDIPSNRNGALPRPIPHDVLEQLDPLLHKAIEDIAAGREPPYLDPIFWDTILIMRRTGLRFADLAHLEAPDKQNRGGCLRQDSDGDLWLHIRAAETKMKREHQIPCDPRDGTREAILRQNARIQNIPNHFGKNYLFRTPNGVLQYAAFYKALKKLGERFLYLGKPYQITPHQFRHTIATDMIDLGGVDIFTVKEFLGHSSVTMTERYVKLYNRAKKERYQDYRSRRTDFSFLPLSPQFLPKKSGTLTEPPVMKAGWVEGYEGKLFRFELPSRLAVCEQPPELRLACVVDGQCSTRCAKMRAGPQHLSVWEERLALLQQNLAAVQGFSGYEWTCEQHETEIQQAEKVIATIKMEGYWDGRIHNYE